MVCLEIKHCEINCMMDMKSLHTPGQIEGFCEVKKET